MKTEKDKKAILFHDLLSPVSSVRSILYFILMEKKQPLAKATKKQLQECLKYCDQLVKKLQSLQRDWEKLK